MLGPVRPDAHIGCARFRQGYLVVSDIEAARNALVAAGVDVSEVFHIGPDGPVPGPDPERRSYFSRATFSDPDATSGCCRRSRRGCPGASTRGATSYSSVGDLGSAMRRAAVTHGEHERRTGKADANWPDWYAE